MADSPQSLKRQHQSAALSGVPNAVDNTDWLKTAAIIWVSIDHFGYFFMEDDLWWAAFGRLAAPAFFFLLGYAKSRTVPFRWIWLGVVLTLLDSWNADWTWVAPNILLSFALIRLVRPFVQTVVRHHGWVAFALLFSALLAVLPIAANSVDYGAEGWMWALFGLYQRLYVDRLYVDRKSAAHVHGAAPSSAPSTHTLRSMSLLACLVAAVVYIWQEQKEFSFLQVQLAVVFFGVGLLSLSLCLFQRGPSRVQPPGAVAWALHFVGRHTLEIYAIQLAVSELLVGFVPDLAP